jgi:hypothetical protein
MNGRRLSLALSTRALYTKIHLAFGSEADKTCSAIWASEIVGRIGVGFDPGFFGFLMTLSVSRITCAWGMCMFPFKQPCGIQPCPCALVSRTHRAIFVEKLGRKVLLRYRQWASPPSRLLNADGVTCKRTA